MPLQLNTIPEIPLIVHTLNNIFGLSDILHLEISSSFMAADEPRLLSTATMICLVSHDTSHLLNPSIAVDVAFVSGSSWIWTRASAIGGGRSTSTINLDEKTPKTAANSKRTEN
ncbi:unnamed protein product [Arabis nemorensis]|uniref:Uncharacterized protein n=1 Tax=Arabis nemorensis TaxID=586526 RepID=A0A565CDZ3_9BRAS|nr:unnamed protein product [Arabis nemorensis]